MPRYDYDCAACGRRFETIHGVHADPPAACPLCGGGPIKKAFAPPTIVFKGSGWAKKERRGASASGTKGAGDDAGAGGGPKDGAGEGAPATSTTSTAGTGEAGSSSTPATTSGVTSAD